MRDSKAPRRSSRQSEVAAKVADLRGQIRLEKDRQIAARVFQALARGERTWSDLTRPEQAAILAVPTVELLLEKSFDSRYRDPGRMIALAEAARSAVEAISPRRYGRRLLADLRARVWAELGNAHRVSDDLFAAEEALARAVHWIRRGTADLLLQARVRDVCASLLSDQGRFGEAVEVLNRVQKTYLLLGDDHLAGRALISMGIFTGYNDEPEQAVVLLLSGWRRLDPDQDRDLHTAAFQSILWNLADCGEFIAARAFLDQRKQSLGNEPNRLNQNRFEWLEGRIAFGLGAASQAEAAFESARRGFREAGKAYDAALVSLDIALLYVQQGRRLETQHLAEEMIATFRAHGIAREALASLALLKKSCADRDISAETLRGQIQAISALVTGLPRRAGHG